MNDPVNIIFLLGLSGTGKTSLAEHMAKNYDWLHLDLDVIGTEGLENNGLADAWLEFKTEKNAKPLVDEITSRFKKSNKAGAILSFPSTRMVESAAIEAIKGKVNVFYLSGTKENCLHSFMEREKVNPRNLDQDYWIKHNEKMLNFLSRPKLARYKIEVFKTTGERRPTEELLNEMGFSDAPTLSFQ